MLFLGFAANSEFTVFLKGYETIVPAGLSESLIESIIHNISILYYFINIKLGNKCPELPI